jgi:cytochrome c-type biogenesis protein CcmH/NrfG
MADVWGVIAHSIARGARSWALVWLGGIALVYGALYARVAGFAFVWDDLTTIRDSPQFDRPLADSLRVTQHGHIDESLTKLREVAPEHESYRPLLFLTFAAEVAWFGRSAAVMHVTNVILGLLAMLVAFAVASALLRSRAGGVAVAGMFALHPLHVEPVSYLSARADLLSGLLALSSAGLALWAGSRRAREGGGRGLVAALVSGSCLLFLLSLFAKEGTIGLPLAVGALWLIDRRRRLVGPILALLAMVPLYFVVRAIVLSGAPAMAHGGSVLRGALALPGLALQYLVSFVAPADLSVVRPLRFEYVVAGWIAAVLAVGLIVRARLRPPQTPAPESAPARFVAGGLGWAVATTGPAAVVAAMMGVAADRYAYLPVFGFALAAVALARALWEAWPRWRTVMAASATGWALLCTGASHLAIAAWKDPVALYENAVHAEPESSAAHYGMGVVRSQDGRWRESMTAFETAAALDPANMRAWNNLAVVYLNFGRLDDAQRAARRALHLSDGTHFRAWYNLATVQLAQGRVKEACASLERARAINPSYAKAAAQAAQHCGGIPRVSDNGRR